MYGDVDVLVMYGDVDVLVMYCKSRIIGYDLNLAIWQIWPDHYINKCKNF